MKEARTEGGGEGGGRCHGRECPSVFQRKSLSLDMISGLGARDPERILP